MNETLPSSEHPTASSRYERVKSILDAAAGQSTADYQGYGRFWHLPLDEFLQVSIYGQRMVAPAPPAAPGSTATAKNPCHCPSDPAGQIGRGAASGLVRGLRGQFPFDGEQFPPLPWGGMPVTEPDISFIERWIDDGCPATDASGTSQVPPPLPNAVRWRAGTPRICYMTARPIRFSAMPAPLGSARTSVVFPTTSGAGCAPPSPG